MKLTFSHYFALLMPSRQNGMTLLKRLQQLLSTTAGRKWVVLNVSNTSWPNKTGCKRKFCIAIKLILIRWCFVNLGISTLCKKLSWTPCNNRKKMWCAKNSFSQKARILCCSKWFMTHMFYTNKQHLKIPRKTKCLKITQKVSFSWHF